MSGDGLVSVRDDLPKLLGAEEALGPEGGSVFCTSVSKSLVVPSLVNEVG